MTVHPHKESNEINITRGVRQEDSISLKLFTAALENIFCPLTWKTRDFKIDDEYLSQLRFADDILMCANTPYELQQMLQELTVESENQVLKTNKSKTKVIMENENQYKSTTLRPRTLKASSTWDIDTAQETTKPRQGDSKTDHAWRNSSDIFKGDIGPCSKRQVYNSCVLLAMAYGAETCPPPKQRTS